MTDFDVIIEYWKTDALNGSKPRASLRRHSRRKDLSVTDLEEANASNKNVPRFHFLFQLLYKKKRKMVSLFCIKFFVFSLIPDTMGIVSSKNDLLKHRQSQETVSDTDSQRPSIHYNTGPFNNTTPSSHRGLTPKFFQKSNSSKLPEESTGNSELTFTSGSSCDSKPTGLLSKIKKKKKRKSHLSKDNTSVSVSSLGSFQTCDTYEDESGFMSTTAAPSSMLLKRHDYEDDMSSSQTMSYAPCIISQNPELQHPASKLGCSSNDLASTTSTSPSCDTPYSTTSVPAVPANANKYQLDCERYKKEWLATPKYCGIHKGLSSQEVLMDLFLQPNNEADRIKEKDRQQRLVRSSTNWTDILNTNNK